MRNKVFSVAKKVLCCNPEAIESTFGVTNSIFSYSGFILQMQITNAESEISSTTVDNHSGVVRTHHARNNSINSHKMAGRKRADERERSLVLTLVVVVVFFLIFWTPYAFVVLLSPDAVTPLAKRACGWLALSNR